MGNFSLVKYLKTVIYTTEEKPAANPRPNLKVRIRVRVSYLRIGIRIYGYGYYIKAFGSRARYKSVLHLLRTVREGVAVGFSSVYITRLKIFRQLNFRMHGFILWVFYILSSVT